MVETMAEFHYLRRTSPVGQNKTFSHIAAHILAQTRFDRAFKFIFRLRFPYRAVLQ